MQITRRGIIGSAALAGAGLAPGRARAQSSGGAQTIKIGVLNDMSGAYRDITGMLSVAAVRQAVQDLGDPSLKVEIVFADHQNKPDVGVTTVRQWIDRDGVDVIVDVPTSSVALAVNNVVREKNRVYLNSGAATGALTGPQCTPNTVHWGYDTYMLAKSTGGALVKAGGDTWYFVTANYVFGQELQRETTTFVQGSGGKVLGASAYPFPGTSDFSSFLTSAQGSGAKVLGLATAGTDTTNNIKQAAEFGLTRKMQVAALLMFINDVHGLGLDAAQGLFLTESFYWDLNERTRAFTERMRKAMASQRPNMITAGCYAGVTHYLKALKEGGVASKADGAAVVARMKAMPTDDDAYGAASIRQDGLALVPGHLFQVKKPSESKGAWDYYKLVATTPPDQAWKPLAETGCPLVKA